MAAHPVIEHPSDSDALGYLLAGVERQQYELNRVAARRAATLADAIGFAREHPDIYALPGDPDAVSTAERCAVIDAALRLQMSENQIRNLTHTVDRARAMLPLLWDRAWEGFATLTQVEIGVDLLPQFSGHDDARGVFDAALADAVLTCVPGALRAKARRLAARLAPADPVAEYREAFTRRRVYVEPDESGMSWVHLYTDTATARAIYRRATSTAKNMRKRARHGRIADPRTRDQVRADLAAGWLMGMGTPTAVKTKVFVTVPADVLTETARASIRHNLPVPAGAPDLNEAPRLDTGETIDRATAIRLLLEAGSFTRLITDPVTGVILDMDRRSRTATRQQREWLIQTHATCARDGCTHAAADSDIDHWDPYNGRNRGPTDLSNLSPLCATDNQDKQRTRFRYRRRADGTVQLATPTGRSTRPPRPGENEARDLLRRIRDSAAQNTAAPSLTEDPPF